MRRTLFGLAVLVAACTSCASRDGHMAAPPTAPTTSSTTATTASTTSTTVHAPPAPAPPEAPAPRVVAQAARPVPNETSTTAPADAPGPCGRAMPTSTRYEHVVWIWME